MGDYAVVAELDQVIGALHTLYRTWPHLSHEEANALVDDIVMGYTGEALQESYVRVSIESENELIYTTYLKEAVS